MSRARIGNGSRKRRLRDMLCRRCSASPRTVTCRAQDTLAGLYLEGIGTLPGTCRLAMGWYCRVAHQPLGGAAR